MSLRLTFLGPEGLSHVGIGGGGQPFPGESDHI